MQIIDQWRSISATKKVHHWNLCSQVHPTHNMWSMVVRCGVNCLLLRLESSRSQSRIRWSFLWHFIVYDFKPFLCAGFGLVSKDMNHAIKWIHEKRNLRSVALYKNTWSNVIMASWSMNWSCFWCSSACTKSKIIQSQRHTAYVAWKRDIFKLTSLFSPP